MPCRLLDEATIPDSQRLLLHFGLGHVLDARGEYGEAARHLQRGNALQQADWRQHGSEYRPQEHESYVTRMIAVCTPSFVERVRGFGFGQRGPGVRRGPAAVRHDARRADPGPPILASSGRTN